MSNESFRKAMFFLYYVVTHPIYKFAKSMKKRFFNLVKKPTLLMKFEIVIMVLLIFRRNVINFFQSLQFQWGIAVNAMIAIIIITHIWRCQDPSLGEPWQDAYNERFGWKFDYQIRSKNR